MTHYADLQRRDDVQGVRCVVTYADNIIWISPALFDQARDPGRERITGDLELHGHGYTTPGTRFSFGTDGEGLGRLTYEITGWSADGEWLVARREEQNR